MTVWVTGANGQVGRCLRRLFLTPETDGYAFLDRDDLDVSSESAVHRLAELVPPRAIINLAAYTNVNKAEDEVEAALNVNGLGPKNLADVARQCDATLVHVSTDYVFDGQKHEPYREDDPVNPQNVYGRSKLLGEEYVQEYCPKHVIIRTSWVFSEFAPNFLTAMTALGLSKESLRIVSDQVGGPTHADDLARVIWRCVDSQMTPADQYGLFHYSGQPFVSWADFATEIFSELSRLGCGPVARVEPVKSSEYPQPARRPLNSRLDSSKIFAAYGIGESNWRQGMRRSIESVRSSLC